MMLIPGYTEKEPTPGIPLEIWTENYVSGDNQVKDSKLQSQIQRPYGVKLINNSPVFNQPNVIRIEKESEFEQGKINLVDIEKVFTDADKNDMKIIEIETSDKLKDILEFDKKTNKLKFSSSISNIDELPAGLHKIILRIKDSSGNMGDKSGFTSGQLRLL